MFCPFCGSKNTRHIKESPNGGAIYVAEEMSTCTEFYAEVTEWDCLDCNKFFFPMTN